MPVFRDKKAKDWFLNGGNSSKKCVASKTFVACEFAECDPEGCTKPAEDLF